MTLYIKRLRLDENRIGRGKLSNGNMWMGDSSKKKTNYNNEIYVIFDDSRGQNKTVFSAYIFQ